MSVSEIQAFITQEQAKGTPKSEIAKTLIGQGHSVEDINAGFDGATSGVTPTAQPATPASPENTTPEPSTPPVSPEQTSTPASSSTGAGINSSEPMQLKQQPPHSDPTPPASAQESAGNTTEPHAYSIPQQNASSQQQATPPESASPQPTSPTMDAESTGRPTITQRTRPTPSPQPTQSSGGSGFLKTFIGLLIAVIVIIGAGVGLHAAGIVTLPFEIPFVEEYFNSEPEPVMDPTDSTDVSSQPIPQTDDSVNGVVDVTSDISMLTDAHTSFGFNVLQKLAEGNTGENIFISPTSISLALSMVYNGATDVARVEMRQALQFADMDSDTINQHSRSLMQRLANNNDVEVSIANSLWARQGVGINSDFQTMMTNYYNAEIAELDFMSPTAASTINNWVANATQDKITSIVSSPISSDVMMYIINAVYFKGDWTTAFDEELTMDRAFTTAEGTEKQHPFMRRNDTMEYMETETLQSVRLPYGENEQMSMYVVLPDDVSSFVQNIDSASWDRLLNEHDDMEGTLFLPKFVMEYERELETVLSDLGMPTAFTMGNHFAGIADDLFISSVKHKTFVDVNETGTEAAAVTSVEMTTTSVPVNPPETFTMDVNRPFVIIIRDDEIDENLFLGIITNPELDA